MPDFTLEVYFHSTSAENFDVEAPSSKPDKARNGDPAQIRCLGGVAFPALLQ